MRRTKEQAAQTRLTILEAAKTLFLQTGYEQVSLDEIAAAAGVKRGAVHFHFLNKAGLLAAICEEMRLPMQELAEHLEIDGTLAPLEALSMVIAELFAELDGDPRRRGLMRITMAADASRSDDLDLNQNILTFHDRAKDTLLEIFRAAERKGALAPPWDAQSAALALHGLIGGLLSEFARREDSRLIPESLTVVQTLLTALGAKAAPRSCWSWPGRR
jgi:TetR/AcrR family acrAB operon transcriptional repressor